MSCSTGCGRNGDCSEGGCNRINFHDWLDNMLPPGTPENQNIYEVKFRGFLKGYYKNVHRLDLYPGDWVVVECEKGYDIGKIGIGGQLVRLQLKKKNISENEVLKIYRKATEEDLKKFTEIKSREYSVLIKTRQIIANLKLEMKLSEVFYQADGTKATFYYIADNRVDFRELIKILAEEFKIRVEMRQIGLRQESSLMGGIGSCGRELCCSTWIENFKNVTTASARYQNISLNPSKITGLCGRLKCCLNYELEVYLDALNDIPDVKELKTELGTAILQKVDIFKKIMWFGYPNDDSWVGLPVEKVHEIIQLNQQGIFPPTLSLLDEIKSETSQPIQDDFVDVVGQSNLHLEPEKKSQKTNKKPDKKNKSK
jgi:cell fate regulator YaaT (PSP1 superfamily)